MGKIENYISFVKEQVEIQQKLARRYEETPYRAGLHEKTAANLTDLANFLVEVQNKGTRDTSYLNREDSPQKRISITWEDIEGAPDELVRELNLTDTDKQDLLIEYLIAQSGGVLSLDKIMVELYKRSREVPKRNTIISRLYRMAGRKMIYNVPGKKGVYSTYEMSEQDAKKMFGEDGDGEEAPAEPAATAASTPAPPPAHTQSSSDRPRPLSLRPRPSLLGSAAVPNLPRRG